MKRILVPTDFSECADSASDAAILLAKKSNAELYFLHLTIDPRGPSHVPGKSVAYEETELGQAKYKLDQLVKKAETAGLVAKSELVLGNGQERIEDYIDTFGIDWMVMGSHGATGIREAIIGSKTQHVIRNIKVPSLVVKHVLSQSHLSNVVFASTFKEDVSQALAVVVDFAKMCNSTVHLLFINLYNHLIDEDVARMMMIKQSDKHPGVDFTFNITETNDKEFGIAEFASNIGADVIAVAMESKGLLGRLFNPTLTEKLINHSRLPVLIANPE